MSNSILTDRQLRTKLVNYGFIFSSNEFDELKNLGFYHVFNSFVRKNIRTNGDPKNLSDYLKLYKLDLSLRATLFPMIIGLENYFKQRFNDTLIKEIQTASSNFGHHNEFVKHCIKRTNNIDCKRLLFQATNNPSPISEHFFSNHKDIPIWGYLELLDLGKFLKILRFTTDKDDNPRGVSRFKEKFSDECKLFSSTGSRFTNNTKASYISDSLNFLRKARNNMAHNQPIIDGRYVNGRVSRNLNNVITDLARSLKPGINMYTPFDFKKVTHLVTLLYINYIFYIGKDELSNRCIYFINDVLNHNNGGLNTTLHSNIFGGNASLIAQSLLQL